MTITLRATEKQSREYYISDSSLAPLVKKGDMVEEKQIVAKSKESRQKIQTVQAGRVTKLTEDVIVIEDLEPEVVAYSVPAGRNLLVKEGETVKIGAKLTEGHINLQDLMDTAGALASESYIV